MLLYTLPSHFAIVSEAILKLTKFVRENFVCGTVVMWYRVKLPKACHQK
jgi:hypothetical protein